MQQMEKMQFAGLVLDSVLD